MSADILILAAIQENTEVLREVLAELKSWREGPEECPHPEDQRRDFSTMGSRWIQCGACGADLVRDEAPGADGTVNSTEG